MANLDEVPKKKSLIVLAVELSSNQTEMGRIRLASIPNASNESLKPLITKNVKPGTTVSPDGWQGYNFVAKAGFKHDVKRKKNDEDVLPHLHRVFSLLQRWLLGTYQGGVQKKKSRILS